MYKILVIANPEVSRGFRFSGAEVKSADSPDTAKKLLLDSMKTKDYGIIVIDNGFLQAFDGQTKEYIETSSSPLVVPMPLEMKWRTNHVGKDDYVREMIRRAIGYQIKIK